MGRSDCLVSTSRFNRTALGAVVIEVTDNIACHLFIIWVFDLELVIQAMRGCKEVRFSVVSRVVDKRSRATGRPVDNHQDYAAFDSVVTGCRILVAGDDRHTSESRKVGLRFRESEVSIAVVHLADREFSRESGFRRFLVFDDQLVSLDRGHGQNTTFRIVQVVERAQDFRLVAIVQEYACAFGQMVFTEHYIEGERTFRTYSEPPDLCPVGQGETDSGILRRIVCHELIGKAESIP